MSTHRAPRVEAGGTRVISNELAGDDAPLRRFGAEVGRATGFVEIAKLVCAATRLLGVDSCTVSHHAVTGRPLLAVDNIVDGSNDCRLSWVCGGAWRRDPLYVAMLAHQRPVVEVADGVEIFLTPILEPAGVLGSIRCLSPTLSRGLERDLFTVATVVSVRFVCLGITALTGDAVPARVTPRQCQIAELAVRGLTNFEISKHLGISMNTVKNRLKEAFERLEVRRRVELVGALRTVSRDVNVPFGISRHGGFTIARAHSAGSDR